MAFGKRKTLNQGRLKKRTPLGSKAAQIASLKKKLVTAGIDPRKVRFRTITEDGHRLVLVEAPAGARARLADLTARSYPSAARVHVATLNHSNGRVFMMRGTIPLVSAEVAPNAVSSQPKRDRHRDR